MTPVDADGRRESRPASRQAAEAGSLSGTGPVMDTFWRDVWSATMRNARPATSPAMGPGAEGAGDWEPTTLRVSADVLPLIRSNLNPALQVRHRVPARFGCLNTGSSKALVGPSQWEIIDPAG